MPSPVTEYRQGVTPTTELERTVSQLCTLSRLLRCDVSSLFSSPFLSVFPYSFSLLSSFVFMLLHMFIIIIFLVLFLLTYIFKKKDLKCRAGHSL